MKAATELPLRILTHNIRYATGSPFRGERPWEERRQPLLNELLFNTRHQDAFICLQEVLHRQIVDIHTGLNATASNAATEADPTWAYIGVGRDDGKEAGEYSPIFYRPAVWQLEHWETTWLSETPDRPSKSWDAASTRIVTVGVFKHRSSRRTVLALNTHLDDQGSRSRYEAAHIILGKIAEYRAGPYGESIAGVFLTGDFNSEEEQEAYQALTGPESGLADAGKLVDAAEHYGNTITWTGFGYEGQPPTRIDYVLLETDSASSESESNRRQPWQVEGYAVLANRFDDGIYNSDHRAVVSDVRLSG